MIEMDLVLVSSGSLVRTPLRLGRICLQPLDTRSHQRVSTVSPEAWRRRGARRDLFQRRSPGGTSGASLNARDSPQLLRIESP